ncbi:MAG: primosomal protein N' [Candidatus Cloacimonetes bacterium]|nr:primosomal protein N' [Candidatus Cloacimonadota bacterium]
MINNMFYYNIALPLKIDQLFVYMSSAVIKKGCRVIVSFKNTILTGIVWDKVTEINPELKYKEILEVVDLSPKILNELLELAQWISNYYKCTLGQTLAAMLPSAFNIQVQLKVRKLTDRYIPDSNGNSELILNELSKLTWMNIKDLKKKINIKGFQSYLEKLEDLNLIEIKRVYDAKIKKKVVNFIIVNISGDISELTKKQLEAFNYMKKTGKSFPLSQIAKIYSYSILKNLTKKGIIRIEPREITPQTKLFNKSKRPPKVITLTQQQIFAVTQIEKTLDEQKFRTFLLFGITGSGKTEVYIEVIKICLKKEKTALMLVPEISLTPQMLEIFYGVFGEGIAILHSHLNDRERWEQWRNIRAGRCKIVIGARSAIFAPLENIGVIIVDEEHENSYKQESNPRYNGRDIAIVRGKNSNAAVILGSATPSLESWFNVSCNKYTLLSLEKRPLTFKLPSVQIIDMCKHENHKQPFSKELIQKIEEKLELKEQIILFQNRRGHSSFVQCVNCGKLFKCSQCEVSMKFHSSTQELICHYCGTKIKLPRKCTDCGSYVFNFGAPGTQQIEKQLQILFPTARILRMDSDSTHKKDSYDSMFERMLDGNIDILLGTQMIAKGLDFTNVTLVGVVSADISLNLPDFRAAERTFQLLTQVAGRSGRGEKPGEVIIQTYNPDHYAVRYAMDQNYKAFAEEELVYRNKLHYPPYYKIARLLFSCKDEKYLKLQMEKIKVIIQKLKSKFDERELIILGPVPSPLIKLQKKYRYHIILKAVNVTTQSKAVNYLKENLTLSSTINWAIDINPYSLL